MKADRSVKPCRIHGVGVHVRRSDGYWRCRQCRIDAVAKRRRRVKEILVAEAGSRCVRCGFDEHLAGLQFHHLDRATKQFGLAHKGVTISIERAREEAAKCALLCANCHAGLEAGYLKL
jgi:hypothetical protein